MTDVFDRYFKSPLRRQQLTPSDSGLSYQHRGCFITYTVYMTIRLMLNWMTKLYHVNTLNLYIHRWSFTGEPRARLQVQAASNFDCRSIYQASRRDAIGFSSGTGARSGRVTRKGRRVAYRDRHNASNPAGLTLSRAQYGPATSGTASDIRPPLSVRGSRVRPRFLLTILTFASHRPSTTAKHNCL